MKKSMYCDWMKYYEIINLKCLSSQMLSMPKVKILKKDDNFSMEKNRDFLSLLNREILSKMGTLVLNHLILSDVL